jgi:hypothetical protein
MNKGQVTDKYRILISRYNLLIEDIHNVLETVPPGTLNHRAMKDLTEWLTMESNGMWARMELVQRINKGGGYPISEYDFLHEVQRPMDAAIRDFRRLLAHIEQQKVLHQMYNII